MGFKGDDKQKRKDLDSVFAWSFAWGMGAALDEKSKDYFDGLVKELFKTASFPAALTVYDYFYDLKKEKAWKEWQTRVERFEYSKDMSYFDMMVPTADTYKHRYCLELLLGI
jgi:dynein heavy chain